MTFQVFHMSQQNWAVLCIWPPWKMGREIKGQRKVVGRGKKGTLPHPYPLLPHFCSCLTFCAAWIALALFLCSQNAKNSFAWPDFILLVRKCLLCKLVCYNKSRIGDHYPSDRHFCIIWNEQLAWLACSTVKHLLLSERLSEHSPLKFCKSSIVSLQFLAWQL